GLSASSVNLAANGQPLTLDSNGDFAAVVSLGGASTLNLVLSGATGDTWTNFTIPLTGPGVIPAGVVDEVEHAGAVVTAVSGAPLTVKGSVADPGQLSALGLNGQDVLDQVKQDGSFAVQVPGTTRMLSL